MKKIVMFFLAVALCGSAPVAAQEPVSEGAPAGAVLEEPTTLQPAAPPPTVGRGLPPRAAPPRTMAAHWPMFALFAATWVAIVGYLVLSGRKVSRLAARVAEQEGGR